MQKMIKRGFRDERKRNPHPVPLPRRGGMWRRKREGIIRELGNLKMRKWGGVGP